jgi:hypothetical protein
MEALEIARQTGMAFMGPSILAGLALTTDDLEERARFLREGEAVLRDNCLAHAFLFFHSSAIDAALASRDWDAVLRYADNLEEYVRAEPIVWARFVAERGRALAALGRYGPSEGPLPQLARLREECLRTGYAPFLPAIEAAIRER